MPESNRREEAARLYEQYLKKIHKAETVVRKFLPEDAGVADLIFDEPESWQEFARDVESLDENGMEKLRQVLSPEPESTWSGDYARSLLKKLPRQER
jgi:hypothetical protein